MTFLIYISWQVLKSILLLIYNIFNNIVNMSVEPIKKLNLKALRKENIDSWNIIEENQIDSSTKDIILQENSIDTIPKENPQISQSDTSNSQQITKEDGQDLQGEESSTPIPQGHKISFADLQKQIEDKSLSSEDRAQKNKDERDEASGENNTERNLTKQIKIEVAQEIEWNTNNTDTQESYHSEEVSNKNELTSEEERSEKQFERDLMEKQKLKSKENEKDSDTSINKDVQILENANKAQSIIKEKLSKEKSKKKLFSFFKRKKKSPPESNNNALLPENKNTLLQEKEEKKGKEIHFSNYESHFKKESSNFLKRFQKFKYTPSTRVGLVLSLIAFTVICISSLMIFFPEKHSLSIYKASIIQLTTQWEEIPIQEIPKQNISQEPVEVIQEEEETIPWDISNWEAIDPLAWEDSNIWKEEESKERLRQHLLNKYK